MRWLGPKETHSLTQKKKEEGTRRQRIRTSFAPFVSAGESISMENSGVWPYCHVQSCSERTQAFFRDRQQPSFRMKERKRRTLSSEASLGTSTALLPPAAPTEAGFTSTTPNPASPYVRLNSSRTASTNRPCVTCGWREAMLRTGEGTESVPLLDEKTWARKAHRTKRRSVMRLCLGVRKERRTLPDLSAAPSWLSLASMSMVPWW